MRQRERICPAHALCTAATIDSCAMAKIGSPVLASSASRITEPMSEHCLRPRDLPVRTGRAKFKYPESDEMNLHAVADVREQVRVMENIQQALKAQTAVLNDRGASAQSHASARKGMEVCVDALDGLTGSFKKTVPRMNGADASAYVDARLQSERKRKHRMQGGRDLTQTLAISSHLSEGGSPLPTSVHERTVP